jgi:hypothetical protein
MNNGFQIIDQQLWIAKDPEAQLFYTFDWTDWLDSTDTLASVNYTITTRVNDPVPLVKVSQGINAKKTYVELNNGQLGKSYTVSAKIVTGNGLEDRRNFKVRIENKSA